MSEDYQASLRDLLTGLPMEEAPTPWKLLTDCTVGGLMEIGFASGTDTLLVVSSQGRGIFDCETGAKLARDPAGDWAGFDPEHLTSPGIGDWADTTFRLAGLHGGGLPLLTSDGWGLHCVPLPWPRYYVFISRPWPDDAFDRWIKIAATDPCEFRACGFSDTGRSFVVASSCELLIFSRVTS